MLRLALILLALPPVGCTTRITSPSGWAYESTGFDRQIGGLHIEHRPDGTTVVDLENYNAESSAAANVGKALDLANSMAGRVVSPLTPTSAEIAWAQRWKVARP